MKQNHSPALPYVSEWQYGPRVSSSGSQKSQEASLTGRGSQVHTFLIFNIFPCGQKFLGDLLKQKLLTVDQRHSSKSSLPSSSDSELSDYYFYLTIGKMDTEKTTFFTAAEVFVPFTPKPQTENSENKTRRTSASFCTKLHQDPFSSLRERVA